jgi:hypothetical protein
VGKENPGKNLLGGHDKGSREMFRSLTPKLNSVFRVHKINTGPHVFQNRAIDLGMVKQGHAITPV